MTMPTRARRASGLLAGVLSAALLLTACGSSADEGDDDSPGASSEGYPVTVDSAHGEFTLQSKPERIVVIGADYVDLLHALGEQPLAFNNYGEPNEEALVRGCPWLATLDTSTFDSALVTAEFKADPEAIALHEPDLIIGTPYYIGDEQYEQLSMIAPTYVTIFSSDRDWTDNLTDLGTLTGKVGLAAQAVSDVESQFVTARDRLSGLHDRTFNLAWYTGDGLRMPPAYGWVEDLGLVHADNQPGIGAQAENLSRENLDQFAGDVAFIQADEEGRASLEADPRFTVLPSVENGTMFFVDRPVIDAGLAAGPTSLMWLLDQIVPLLEESPLNAAGQ